MSKVVLEVREEKRDWDLQEVDVEGAQEAQIHSVTLANPDSNVKSPRVAYFRPKYGLPASVCVGHQLRHS